MNTLVIDTPIGKIKGIDEGSAVRFNGVRYASAKRFEMPVVTSDLSNCAEVENGVYDATYFKACCPQKRGYEAESGFYFEEFRKGDEFTYSEDCLHLNICAPAYAVKDEPTTKKLPVIVFVHGGSFTGGSGNERQLDGVRLAERGVIYVSINYRLNVFGFFAGGECNGNFALYDIDAAIRFLSANISAFGGDGNNITLMGQSAGAMLATTYISSGFAHDSVKRAVLLSGGGVRTLLLPLRKPDKKFWGKVMKTAGASTVDELKALDDKTVFESYQKCGGIKSLFATAPVMDGVAVTNKRYDNKMVPCILSTVQNDMLPPVLKAMNRRFCHLLEKHGVHCEVMFFDHPLPPRVDDMQNGEDAKQKEKTSFHSADLWYWFASFDNNVRKFSSEDFAVSDALMSKLISFSKGNCE